MQYALTGLMKDEYILSVTIFQIIKQGGQRIEFLYLEQIFLS